MALVAITGGARSGKSAAAARLAAQRADAGAEVIVVVFGEGDGDPEMAARIELHRQERDERFAVVEAACGRSWMAEVPEGSLVVIDCLGTLVARHMSGDDPDAVLDAHALGSALDECVTEVIAWLARREGDAVVVTNEVGSGVVPTYPSGRVFRDVLGRANASLATVADASYLAVAGRLVDLGALPRDVAWPGE